MKSTLKGSLLSIALGASLLLPRISTALAIDASQLAEAKKIEKEEQITMLYMIYLTAKTCSEYDSEFSEAGVKKILDYFSRGMDELKASKANREAAWGQAQVRFATLKETIPGPQCTKVRLMVSQTIPGYSDPAKKAPAPF